MTTVLVFGGGGQVGRELAWAPWPSHTHLIVANRSNADITDRLVVQRLVAHEVPDIIVNAAAYTKVDDAEDERDMAFAVNETAVGHLAEAADAAGATLIHLSTDYVFDGTKDGWYTEEDRPSPASVYGESKLGGERAALRAHNAIVLRTSWVYGSFRSNFVLTMRRLALERDELGVVADQFGCPTAAIDIANAIVAIVEQGARESGLFHLAAPDDASWWDLAESAISQMEPPRNPVLNRLTTEQFPTRARRPANSRLDSSKLLAGYGIQLPPWRATLASVSAELNSR